MNARWIALTLVASAVIASCAAAAGADSGAPTPRVVVVADASVPRGQALAAVRAAGAGAELRTPRTATEQLSVTHWFAARGYDVVGVGLDEAVAVRPVLRRYPGVRFMLASPR